MRKFKWVFVSLSVAAALLAFQNCGKLKNNDSLQKEISSSGPNPGTTPAPNPLLAGDPTASDIQDVRVVPGETATILIVLNALPQEDLVYTYSTTDDTATAGTHYISVQNGNGGIFAGSPSAQITINTTNAVAPVAYYGKSFKVNVSFPSKPALSKVVRVSFSAAPSGVGLKNQWAYFPGSAFAPLNRYSHSAVWTGTRMIIMGGYYYSAATYYIQNNGKSYDPSTDTWVDINMTGGPGARANHTAVWTGSKMIVWGGRLDSSGTNLSNTGMSYDPVTNLWSPISTTNAPSARYAHTAVWTGTKMIVWGGYSGSAYLSDGGIYDPATNTWTAMTAAAPPVARSNASAVWTGTKMIVWGGYTTAPVADGKAFDPATNTWTDISITGAPMARYFQTAVWTGSKMLIMGGYNAGELGTGGLYDPVTNTWTVANNSLGVFAPRYANSAVWTGSSALYWGGLNSAATCFNDGGIYY
ncbi:MAG: Kelch repeat-containing protein [Bdellovibrionales bacterium]